MSSAEDELVASVPGWFNLGRVWPFPSDYGERKTPVTQDVLIAGWVVAFFALLLPFYLVIPASNNKISRFIRVTVFLLIGLFIMLCNFGQEWEVGYLKTRTPYRVGTADQITADIGMKLGLRSVNITLTGKPERENSSLAGETINYNERFAWTWAQGRSGFGPHAGRIQREYRAAQRRGTPLPILWVAEYFTFDGEGIRFGRYYRMCGWYSHIFIWAAFPMWILTVFMFKMVIDYAAISLTITGVLMVIPPFIWLCLRNPIEMKIIFEHGVLQTRFGWCFYLSLVTGIFCITAGLVIKVLTMTRYHNRQVEFFGNNPWMILDLEDKMEEVGDTGPHPAADNLVEMESLNSQKKECVRQVTMRARGSHSRYQNKVSLEMPNSDAPTTDRNLSQRSYPSSSPASVRHGSVSGAAEAIGYAPGPSSRFRMQSPSFAEDEEYESDNQVHERHISDEKDMYDDAVFESSSTEMPRSPSNLTP